MVRDGRERTALVLFLLWSHQQNVIVEEETQGRTGMGNIMRRVGIILRARVAYILADGGEIFSG